MGLAEQLLLLDAIIPRHRTFHEQQDAQYTRMMSTRKPIPVKWENFDRLYFQYNNKISFNANLLKYCEEYDLTIKGNIVPDYIFYRFNIPVPTNQTLENILSSTFFNNLYF